MADFAIPYVTVAQICVCVQRYACFLYHALGNQFIQLNICGNMTFRKLYNGTVLLLQPPYEFPWDTANDTFSVVVKSADGHYKSGGCCAAQKTVPLHQGGAAAHAGSGNGSNESCRTAATDNHIVFSCHRDSFC